MKVNKKELQLSLLKNVPFVAAIDYAASLVANGLPLAKKVIKDPAQLEIFQTQMTTYLKHPLLNLQHAFHYPIYDWAQFGFAGIATYWVIRDMLNAPKNTYEEANTYGSHGTARWMEEKELFGIGTISSQLAASSHYLGKKEGKHVLQTEQEKWNGMTIICGGAGSGKSSAYIVNNLLMTATGEEKGRKSFVVTDPKGEIFSMTAKTLRASGYKVRVLNFRDLVNSDFYNAFDYIQKDSDCYKVSQIYIQNAGSGEQKGDFWDKSETALLACLMLYVRHCVPKEQQHFGSVFQLLMMQYEELEELFLSLDPKHIVYKAYKQAIHKLEDKVRSNVFQSLNVTMSLFLYDNVVEFTSTSTFKIQNIGKELTAVFLILPVADKTFTPLISTFFTQLFDVLYNVAYASPDRRLPVKLKVLADEFANLGRIHRDYVEILSTARGQGIEITMVIQDLAQLYDRWGENKGKEIRSNCDVTLFLGTNALETSEYFSELLGPTTIRVQSHNEQNGGKSEGQSEQNIERPLLTASEVRTMDKDKAILFMIGRQPVLLEKGYWYEDEEFKGIMDKHGTCDVMEYIVPELGNYSYTVYEYVKKQEEQKESDKNEKKERRKEKTVNKEMIEVEMPSEEDILFRL